MERMGEEKLVKMVYRANVESNRGKYLQIGKVQMESLFVKMVHSDKNNYMPVSLTSTVDKLLESIIRERVQKFLGENK